MLFVIIGIVIVLILIAAFSGSSHKNNASNIDWWTIGMIADLHNKSREKDNK